MTGADFLQLDPRQAPRGGLVAWLAEQLRLGIAEGRLTTGVRLPPSRVLATELSMSRGVVVEAYRRLTEEGLLVTNRGGGTLVADDIPVQVDAVVPEREAPARAGLFDISSGMPDLSAFPRAAWARAEREVLATAGSHELGYVDPRGVPALRGALAGWLTRSRGVTVDPDRVIVTAGVTGALSMLVQVLRDRGIAEIAVEDPGAEGNRRILEYWMDEIIPVPVDAQGVDVSALTHSDARIALVTPAHQFPTGVVLAPARRRALIGWADDVDGYVVEDDYDAEYRYDRSPVRALQGMSPDRVVHVSSLSKVLAPALRIGWLIAPSYLHEELVRKRWATDLGSPALIQLALADLIESGALERHLRSLRQRHRQRRDATVAALRRHVPGCEIQGVAAGLHLVVRLGDDVNDAEVARRARDEGILVHPLSRHRFAPGFPGLVIGYGPHSTPRLEQAIEALGRLITA